MRNVVPTRTLTALTLAIALFLAACGSDSGSGSSLRDDLVDREFWSTAVLENGVERQLVEGTRIIVRFDETRIGVSAGCNSIGGTFELEGDRLVTTELFMTEAGCDPERHAQDEFVIDVLADGPTVAIDGTELGLETESVAIRFQDAEVANPDRPIVGTPWTVTGFEDGQAAMSFGVARDAELLFSDDSTLRGFDGCADFEAAVEVADGSTGGPVEGDGELQFGPVDWAPIDGCDDAEYVEMVRRIFDAGDASFTISGTNLRIVGRDGFGLTARAG